MALMEKILLDIFVNQKKRNINSVVLHGAPRISFRTNARVVAQYGKGIDIAYQISIDGKSIRNWCLKRYRCCQSCWQYVSLITADDYSVESDSFASAPFLFRAIGLTAAALCRRSWSGLSDLRARIFEYPTTGFSACSIKRGDAIGANFARTRRKRERSHGLILSSFFDHVAVFVAACRLDRIAFCRLLILT